MRSFDLWCFQSVLSTLTPSTHPFKTVYTNSQTFVGILLRLWQAGFLKTMFDKLNCLPVTQPVFSNSIFPTQMKQNNKIYFSKFIQISYWNLNEVIIHPSDNGTSKYLFRLLLMTILSNSVEFRMVMILSVTVWVFLNFSWARTWQCRSVPRFFNFHPQFLKALMVHFLSIFAYE